MYCINYFDEYYPSTEKTALLESLNRIEIVDRKDDESKKEKHFLKFFFKRKMEFDFS